MIVRDRVISVFVAGPKWQFKDFPWGGQPVDILNKSAVIVVRMLANISQCADFI
jgi:hypothetical protein